AAEKLAEFLGDPDVEDITRADIEEFIEHRLSVVSSATANQDYRSLQQLFKWLYHEDEIPENPSATMRPPTLDEQPVPVLTEDEIQGLLRATRGTDFTARRDRAIITMFLDTGARLSEMGGLKVVHIDWDLEVAMVLGKGRRHRSLPMSPITIKELDR